MPAYVSYVRDLLNQPIFSHYSEQLKAYQSKWSPALFYYFMNEVHSEVDLPMELGLLTPGIVEVC